MKAIVGARIEGPPVIEYSVVVIADGKFRAVGPQATTPVPKGAALTDGKGRVISDPLEVGQPADLVLRNAATGSVESAMKNGEWVK
jgi:cytosine/adenosine deaminase-related metal-dependent hydrolase